ncbi:MAG: TauD/TfdA family dioxygenase [Novosphingobium sp.]|nr:TauD/TfdA family dioxygenase [Novosphingobium sp.]
MADSAQLVSDIRVSPIAGALGAEIAGVDLNRELDARTIGHIRQALLDHLVVFFRDQDLTPQSYMRFAEYFGPVVEYPMLKGIDGYPFIIEIVKEAEQTVNFGGVWHADTTYLETPAMGAMLHAIEVPPRGGDTLWANQYLAYETLSEPLRSFLDGLTVISSSAKADISKTREDMLEQGGAPRKEFLSEHPAVRTHPETGRKSLFVNPAHSVQFKGMTEEESTPILNYLYTHQVRPEFTCRFRWQKGSLAFWDNRCTMHNPINDYHGYRRAMRRISLGGDRPV